MLARGDNVSNVSRAFRCHRNTIIRLRQRFQQTGWVADRHRFGRPRVTNPRTDKVLYADAPSTSFSNGDKFCKAVRYQQTDRVAPPQARPATHSAKVALYWDKCLQHVIGLPVCCGHDDISVLGRQQWARVLFSDESRFNLSHHDGRIRVFRRRGERFADNCLTKRCRF